MAGVYVHIPFCRKACNYCNFHFSTSLRLRDQFIKAIEREIELQKNYLSSPVSTIYFGGGTPSILPLGDLKKIITKLHENFAIDIDAEITLEANPDDINAAKLAEWQQAGINRLSIGIQSFFAEDLLWMNRAHNEKQAFECISMAQNAGFQNLTIDLIYGSPTLSDDHWKKNVETAIAFQVPHLSCYALTIEPATALDHLIRQKKLDNIDTDKQARHFELLMSWMKEAGYEHYEISNFARPACRSRHNSSYWQAQQYLGLGPSAHSFNGTTRQWNVASNSLYIQSLSNDIVPFEMEILTAGQQFNEYVMTSLRTMEGLSLQKIEEQFGKEKYEYILHTARPHFKNNHLIVQDQHIKTTAQGKLLADGIASDLFFL